MKDLWNELKRLKGHIPVNTYRTIKGQLKAGKTEAARTGIMRMKQRMEKAYENTGN